MSVRDTFRLFVPPPEGDDLATWRAWFAGHGIDADDVDFDGVPVSPSWVERRDNPGQAQIVYTAAAVDGEGTPILLERTVDLETPPAVFPTP